MFTASEAIQRCQQYSIGFRRFGSLQAQLFFHEDRTNEHSRLIDYDYDEIVSVAYKMRNERNIEQSGDIIFRSEKPIIRSAVPRRA